MALLKRLHSSEPLGAVFEHSLLTPVFGSFVVLLSLVLADKMPVTHHYSLSTLEAQSGNTRTIRSKVRVDKTNASFSKSGNFPNFFQLFVEL